MPITTKENEQKLLIYKQTDIWAIGVLVHMMLFKRYPFVNDIMRSFNFLRVDAVQDIKIDAELNVDPDKY